MDPEAISRTSFKQHLIQAGYIFLLGIPTAVLFCHNCWDQPRFYYITMPFSGLVWVTLWKGNELIFELLDHRMPWRKSPLKRMLVNLAATISYTVLAMTGIAYGLFVISGVDTGRLTLGMIIDYSGTAVVITILISTFMSARGFFLSWRDLAVQNERLKKETVSSRLEVLKQQVNPHFLFNSLNTLTSLVYEDPELSARFIRKLSDVYRYVLESHEKEVVPLQEELEFVESYAYLQGIRHGDHLRVEVDLPDHTRIHIPPLALQMLIENAIKHNEVSPGYPLLIRVDMVDEYITVRNRVQKRESPDAEAAGIGLENIRSRYSILTDRPVIVLEEEGWFSVNLPAIYESP